MSDTPRTDKILNMYFHARGTMLANLAKELECELQDVVKRMEQVTSHDLKITFRKGGALYGLECDAIEAVRDRLIQAAKGEL